MKSDFESMRQRSRIVFLYLLGNKRRLLEHLNRLFFCIVLTFGIMVGSVVSICVIGGILTGIYYIFFGDKIIRINKSVRNIGMAFFFYFFITVFTTIMHPGGKWVGEIVSDGLFLGFIPLIYLVKVRKENLLQAIEMSGALVPIAMTLPAIYSYIVNSEYGRIELAAGNPGITAILASILYLLNIIAIFRREYEVNKMMYIFGAASSILILALTGMRALFPVILILPLFLIWFYGKIKLFMINKILILRVFSLLFFVSLLAYPGVSTRIHEGVMDLEGIAKGNNSGSLGLRLDMWRAGLSLFLESPVFGHGPGNLGEVMRQETLELSSRMISFNHFHNFIITEAVRSGMVGIVAFFAIFWIPFRELRQHMENDMAKYAFSFLTGVFIIYFFSGLTGIALHHDIADSVYLTAVVLAAYFGLIEIDEIAST